MIWKVERQEDGAQFVQRNEMNIIAAHDDQLVHEDGQQCDVGEATAAAEEAHGVFFKPFPIQVDRTC